MDHEHTGDDVLSVWNYRVFNLGEKRWDYPRHKATRVGILRAFGVAIDYTEELVPAGRIVDEVYVPPQVALPAPTAL